MVALVLANVVLYLAANCPNASGIVVSNGYAVEAFACLESPALLAFDSAGNLYVGDAAASGPVRVVSPDGQSVATVGPVLSDPDSVIFDASGAVGSPGTILVGGNNTIYEIDPETGMATALFSGPPLGNVGQMVFDGGKLIAGQVDVGAGVVTIDKGELSVLFDQPQEGTAGVAIREDGTIFVSAVQSAVIYRIDSAGTLLDDPFATLGVPLIGGGIAYASTGPFAGSLFANGRQGEPVFRIDGVTGDVSEFITGLEYPVGLAIGPQGDVFVGDFMGDTIYRVFVPCGIRDDWRGLQGELVAVSDETKALYVINTNPVGSQEIEVIETPRKLSHLAIAGESGLAYSIDYDTDQLLTISLTEACVVAVTQLDADVPSIARGHDVSPSGVLYAAFAGPQLRSVNPSTGTTSFVADITGLAWIESLAFGEDGTLYATGNPSPGDANRLYEIDPITGAATLIAHMGPYDVDILTYNSENGFLYGGDVNANSADLYRINPYTGGLLNLGNTGVVKMSGMAFIRLAADTDRDNDGVDDGEDLCPGTPPEVVDANGCGCSQKEPASIHVGPILNPVTGHVYYVLCDSVWTLAEERAVSLGGHLATVNDEEEHVFIAGSPEGDPPIVAGRKWIGLTDQGQEGNWYWISGEPVTFQKWQPGEPNNTGGAEHYAEIDGQGWNDVPNGGWGFLHKGIVELGCQAAENCADLDENGVRDDTCTWWSCQESACFSTDIAFADMGGPFGDCTPDGFCNVHDRNHALDCFSGARSCDPLNGDAGGAFGDCSPDGFCNVHDANHAIACFANTNTCTCPPGPTPESAPAIVGQAFLAIEAERGSIRPGETVDVRVYVDSATSLQSYQLHLEVSGGKHGHLELLEIRIEDRNDFVFGGTGFFEAFNPVQGQMLAGMDVADHRDRLGGYVSTFTYRASRDAIGDFVIDMGGQPDGGTFLVGLMNGKIEVVGTKPVVIEVQ